MLRFLYIVLFLASGMLHAQLGEAWVYFKDKQRVSFFMEQPEQMLSSKAIQRRLNQNIPLDNRDVPISQEYINQLKESGAVEVLAKSKWLNAVHLRGELPALRELTSLDFVAEIDFLDKNFSTKSAEIKRVTYSNKFEKIEQLPYGFSANQVQMMGVEALHNEGFDGEGLTIAVMDAGFPGVNYFSAFDSIRLNNQILGGYNFVDRNSNIYSRHPHGTSVLSSMGGFVKDTLVGTAPKANYYLFITEDYIQEHPLEESLWVEAAEYADSLGVDIINTSLGYSTFDNENYNYSYEDLNGQTTFISRGAEIAASKGIVVVNSAGNEGNDAWRYITAPADAPSVLTVGAVNPEGQLTAFSSVGPASDGRLKPDVVAQGQGVVVVRGDGSMGLSSGTSFSSPLMAGAIASFWQANRDRTNAELLELVKQSGSHASDPNVFYGYGIPNFKTLIEEVDTPVNAVVVYPNPVGEWLYIDVPSSELPLKLALFSLGGQELWTQQITEQRTSVGVEFLNPGIYLVELGSKISVKIIKN